MRGPTRRQLAGRHLNVTWLLCLLYLISENQNNKVRRLYLIIQKIKIRYKTLTVPRKSIPSTTLLAAVRHYFALQQQQLAAYLGVSPELVKHIEAGRRAMSSALLLGLNPLAQVVPDHPTPDAREFNDVPPAAPEPSLLEARLDECRHKAGQLRRKMRPLARRTRFAKRWQQVLPGLLAATPAQAEAPDTPAARGRRWLLARQADAAADLDAVSAAEWHLLRVRADALEAEAAALAALLPPAAQ